MAGIRKRHSRRCASRAGGACDCSPSFKPWVYSRSKGRKIHGPTFSGDGAERRALEWCLANEAAVKGRRGTPTVREAAEQLLAGMRDGSIRSNRRQPYKPSVIRSYERATGLWPEERERAPERLCERLGDYPLGDLDHHTLQAYVERLLADGWDPSTVAGQLDPLRVIFRRAHRAGQVAQAHDPLKPLDLPKPQGRRERIATPPEAAALLHALPDADRALWATAFYAGLRRGELRAARCFDFDFEANYIFVRRSWDDREGELSGTKNRQRRDVPISDALRRELQRHLLRSGRRGDHLVFGETTDEPFAPSRVRRRALAAWEKAGLKPITLHEGRHTFASWAILAGVNLGEVAEYMGHNEVTCLDRYRHLLPYSRDQAIRRMNRFLEGGGAA